MRVAGQVIGYLVQQWREGFELAVCRAEAFIKLRLIFGVERGQVHRADGVVERGRLRGVIGRQRGNQQRG